MDEIKAQEAPRDFESTFRAEYDHVARVIAKVVRDPARAEELAVEVFLKLWNNPRALGPDTRGWLYRAAVRQGLDELRSQTRLARYKRLLGLEKPVPTPEEIRAVSEEQERVRYVLAAMESRQAELLLLRNQGLSYDELASVLNLNPASIGTFLVRSQQAFRKEYVKQNGEQQSNG